MLHVIWHGHSFVEIVTQKGSILIDPFITGNPRCDISLDEMQKKEIIAVCLTHGHGDHIGDTMAIVKEKNIPVVCEYGVANYFEEVEKYEHCIYGGIGGTLIVNDEIKVKLFAATHGGRILDTNMYCAPAGLLIMIWDKKVYHGGDTSLMLDMQQLADYQVDLAVLPIDGVYNMNTSDAAKAVQYIQPKVVFPIHYDTRPKIRTDAVEFARDVMATGKTVPKVLTPGQYVVIE